MQLTSCFVAEGDDHHLPWLAPLLLDQILYPRCQDACLAAARPSYNPAVEIDVLEMLHIFGMWVVSRAFMLPGFACAIAMQNVHGNAPAPNCWQWAGRSDMSDSVRCTGFSLLLPVSVLYCNAQYLR